MTAARSASKPRLPAWILPILCLTVSILAHAIWTVPGLRLPEERARSQAPEMVLLQRSGTTDWMPVLFSLPSLDGFSGVVRRLDTRLTPPLESPVSMAGPVPLDPLASIETPALPVFPLTEGSLSVLSPAPDVSLRKTPVRSGWRLRFPARPDLRVVLIRDPRIQNPEEGVRLEGVMHFDAFGRLENLFFDPHDLPAQEMDLLLPDVRQVGISPRAAPGRFRFELTFTPDAL